MPSKIMPAFIQMLPDGNYAARVSDDAEMRFFRVDRPEHGKMKGFTKVQTRHSDVLHLCYLIYPEGDFRVYDDRYADHLLSVLADQTLARVRYGQELGKCCICAKTLTDERSRYYGIGPECVTRFRDVVEYVHEQFGWPETCDAYEVD